MAEAEGRKEGKRSGQDVGMREGEGGKGFKDFDLS